MSFPSLFKPIRIGSYTYKNRIAAAPNCGTFATIPFLSSVLLQSVQEKAEGGCAQVTIGETPVDFEYANREPSFDGEKTMTDIQAQMVDDIGADIFANERYRKER